MTYGIMFGAIDVEEDNPNHVKLKLNLLYSLPIGIVIGGGLGFINQWLRATRSDETQRIEPGKYDAF